MKTSQNLGESRGGMLECDFHQILIITIDLVANTITDHIKLLFIW